MGYFSNGTEGDMYEEQYCNRCIHDDREKGCAVMLAHLLRNYEECNKKDSILHILIPRGANGFNEQCRMFIEKTAVRPCPFCGINVREIVHKEWCALKD